MHLIIGIISRPLQYKNTVDEYENSRHIFSVHIYTDSNKVGYDILILVTVEVPRPDPIQLFLKTSTDDSLNRVFTCNVRKNFSFLVNQNSNVGS